MRCAGTQKNHTQCRWQGSIQCMTCHRAICANHSWLSVITSPINLWRCLDCCDALCLLYKINA